MKADIEAVKARIRALLAKTVANGCTEGEALAAAEKAMDMLRQHGLSHDELEIGRETRCLFHSKRQLLDDLWPMVAYACHCRTVLQRGHMLQSLFVGHLPWPEVAAWLQGTLIEAHRRALGAFRQSPQYRRRRTPRTRAAARQQFTLGFVDVVRVKLAELAYRDHAAIRAELAIIDRALAPEMANAKTLDKLGKASAAAAHAHDRGAGMAAGRDTNVSWGVRGAERLRLPA